VFIFLVIGCTSPIYIVTTDRSKIHSYTTKNFDNGGFFSPPTKDYYQNKTIYIPSNISNEPLIDYLVKNIDSRNYSSIERRIKDKFPNDVYLPFANGLLEMLKGFYDVAIKSFKMNRQDNIQFIIDLLTVDCEYEIALINSVDINYNQFLEKYQKILDHYNLDDCYKEIVNSRIKFVRYHY